MSEGQGQSMVTAGALDAFRGGWALFMFVGERAHYWHAASPKTVEAAGLMRISKQGRVRYFRSECGVVGYTTDKVPAFRPGTWPLCKRCAGRLERKAA